MAEMSSTIHTLIFMGYILWGFPISHFVFLNYQMLDTVVFAYSQVNCSWINYSQKLSWLYFPSDALWCSGMGFVSSAKPSIHYAWLHTVFSSSCTHSGFHHTCCHWVRKNLARSDTLPHLRTKKEEIHTPHPARTKHIVVKAASSIGRSCLL